MSKKVLCAIDGSEHSDRAIQEAAEIAKATNRDLILLVVDQIILMGRGGSEHKLGPDVADKVLAAGKIVAAKSGCPDASLVSIACRDVGRAILNYAEEANVDHIVVGTGEKGAATRLMVGSVSHDLVHRAHCTVTIAR
jgi:nucleotide-binding universal stress UspA family protein